MRARECCSPRSAVTGPVAATSNRPPGHLRELHILDLVTPADSVFALDKPEQLAGLKDGSVAVLHEGTVTIYQPDGVVKWTLAFPDPVTAIATVDAGPLAFASGGDLYCARSPTDIVRLTDSPGDELLFQ